MRTTVLFIVFVTLFCFTGLGCDQQLVDPQDPLLFQQSYLSYINAPQLWRLISNRNICNNSLIGYVMIDTGANLTHPDLFAHIDTIWSRDFTTDSNPFVDLAPHGTALLGEMTAVRNNGIGIAGMMAEHVIIYKICIADLNVPYGTPPYLCKMEWIRAAFEALKSLPYQRLMVNLSFTIVGPDETVHNAMANLIDKAVFISAPDNRDDGGEEHTCAEKLPNNICGGAVSIDQSRASFQYGGSVDILCPGENIFTTYGDDVYRSITGASACPPLIFGTGSLLFGEHLEKTPSEVVSALKAKSVNPTLLVDGIPTLDAVRALYALEAKNGDPVEPMTCKNGVTGDWGIYPGNMVTCAWQTGQVFTNQYCVADDFAHVPTELCGVQMFVDGTKIPVFYAKPDSVTGQIPDSMFLFPNSRHTVQIGEKIWTFVVQYPEGWKFFQN